MSARPHGQVQRSMRRGWASITCVLTFLAGRTLAYAGGPDDPPPGALAGESEKANCPLALDPSTPLSLVKAVDLALCNNTQVRAAWANIRVRSAALGEARAADWPTLSVSVSELNDRTTYPGTSATSTDTTGTLVVGTFDWRLFDFGGRSATRHAAEAFLNAAVASRDATIQRILSAVVQTYFVAVSARAAADDKTQDESIARDTLASAQRRQARGGGAQNDTLQATTALARASLDENRAYGSYQKALALLAYTLGVPAGSRIDLAGDIDLRTGTEQKDLSAWLKDAEQQHPAIVAARAAVAAAQDQVIAARSAGRPTIDLTANYYQNGFPNEGLTATNMRVATVGVTVTVPLFDGFATHYGVQGAQATVKVREAELEDTRQATLMAVVEAYADAQSSLGNLDASESLLNAAQAAFESSQRRYTQGVSDIVELLNAQTALADAKSERIRCLAEWRSARLNLLASTGALNRRDLRQDSLSVCRDEETMFLGMRLVP
jgi:outer membrane protein